MARPYFTHLPLINYNGYTGIDILSRVAARQVGSQSPNFYFDYTVKEGQRADMIASDFYNSPEYVWVIYLINNIVDPVHDWPKTEEDLYNFIIAKYGSYADAANQIVFYRNNYDGDDTILTEQEFNNLLVNVTADPPYNQKRFYSPVIDDNYGVIHYKRAELDEIRETNKVIEIVCDATGFLIRERVVQKSGITISASAFISAITDTSIIVNNVTGTFNTANPITGYKSEATTTPTEVNLIKNSISDFELAFFAPVTALEYETELNERKKIIKLVRPNSVEIFEDQLSDLFS